MNNSLPMKQEVGFVHKIKMFFYKMLKKHKLEERETNVNSENNNLDKEQFHQIMQKNVNIINNKKFIIEKIDTYPKILDELPIDRLNSIEQLYDEVLEQEKNQISKQENIKEILNQNSNNLNENKKFKSEELNILKINDSQQYRNNVINKINLKREEHLSNLQLIKEPEREEQSMDEEYIICYEK